MSAVVPEQLRRDLHPSGDAEATIVLTRISDAPVVLLCRPVRALSA
ncbi:MAG: THUMP-like domain-containing protein [Mycobacteriales bacterium]